MWSYVFDRGVTIVESKAGQRLNNSEPKSQPHPEDANQEPNSAKSKDLKRKRQTRLSFLLHLVCRQLYAETHALPYCTVNYALGPPINKPRIYFMRSTLKDWQTAAVTDVQMDARSVYWVPFFFQQLKGFLPGLKRIVVVGPPYWVEIARMEWLGELGFKVEVVK